MALYPIHMPVNDGEVGEESGSGGGDDDTANKTDVMIIMNKYRLFSFKLSSCELLTLSLSSSKQNWWLNYKSRDNTVLKKKERKKDIFTNRAGKKETDRQKIERKKEEKKRYLHMDDSRNDNKSWTKVRIEAMMDDEEEIVSPSQSFNDLVPHKKTYGLYIYIYIYFFFKFQ